MLSWMLTNEQFSAMSNEEMASSILDFSVTACQAISIVGRTRNTIVYSSIFIYRFSRILHMRYIISLLPLNTLHP